MAQSKASFETYVLLRHQTGIGFTLFKQVWTAIFGYLKGDSIPDMMGKPYCTGGVSLVSNDDTIAFNPTGLPDSSIPNSPVAKTQLNSDRPNFEPNPQGLFLDVIGRLYKVRDSSSASTAVAAAGGASAASSSGAAAAVVSSSNKAKSLKRKSPTIAVSCPTCDPPKPRMPICRISAVVAQVIRGGKKKTAPAGS